MKNLKKYSEWIFEGFKFEDIKASNYEYHFYILMPFVSKRPEDDEIEVIADQNINFSVFKIRDAQVLIRASNNFESEGITELDFFKILKSVEEENPNDAYMSILKDDIQSFGAWWKNAHQKFKAYLTGKKFGL